MKTKRLGIAIYPEIVGVEATKNYLDLAHKYDFKRVFANLLEIENDAPGLAKLANLKQVYTYAKSLGFEVIVDVNPTFYKAFNLEPTEIDFFFELGATGIRLDEDFQGVVEAKLSQNTRNFKIELNASAGDNTFDLALKNGANPENLIASHNFYPMSYTGLNLARFIELSTRYQLKNIRVAAFITLPESQKGIGPWNVNDGMPTIEEHRYLDIEEQLIQMLCFRVVDDIIVSQQGLTADQFQRLARIMQIYQATLVADSLTIEVNLVPDLPSEIKAIMFDNQGQPHFNRPDYNGLFFRSTLPRITFKGIDIKPLHAGQLFHPGTMVIINENFNRYKGELHVMFVAIDDRIRQGRNLVATLDFEALLTLRFAMPKVGVSFIPSRKQTLLNEENKE